MGNVNSANSTEKSSLPPADVLKSVASSGRESPVSRVAQIALSAPLSSGVASANPTGEPHGERHDFSLDLPSHPPAAQAHPVRIAAASSERPNLSEVMAFLNKGDKLFKYQSALNMIEVPDNGDCLFEAFRAGLVLKQGPDEKIPSVEMLRSQAIQFLSEHFEDPQALNYLEFTLLVHKEKEKEKLDTELAEKTMMSQNPGLYGLIPQQVRLIQEWIIEVPIFKDSIDCFGIGDYLKLAENPGTYAGCAEIYALSQIYNISIKIGETGFEEFKAPVHAVSADSIRLHFTGNHYNLLLPRDFS